jgi:multiple antibiotic resistance protein
MRTVRSARLTIGKRGAPPEVPAAIAADGIVDREDDRSASRRRVAPAARPVHPCAGFARALVVGVGSRTRIQVEMMEQFLKSAMILFVLLNPFSMTIYLISIIRDVDGQLFRRVVLRAVIISATVFTLFAWTGDLVFRDVLQVRFASFLLFGGLVFLVIGLQMMLKGGEAIETLRGPPEHLAGAIAMPFMIGPATVSASVLIGARLSRVEALLAIAAALAATAVCLFIVKALHDRLRQGRERLITRYLDVFGRVSALVVGTIAVEMILQGLDLWQKHAG